ncbi:hypothetical protein HanRHA438_Chr11g0488371 [Helianthus annuus]|nr:hypothetical protein HanRHA438_Chr11g0488371 [Helianthus annuus]
MVDCRTTGGAGRRNRLRKTDHRRCGRRRIGVYALKSAVVMRRLLLILIVLVLKWRLKMF